jgi:hypothetical protein
MFAKNAYNKKNVLGYPLISVLILIDLFYPEYRKFIAEKRIYPISLAHLGMGFLNLYKTFGIDEYLVKATSFVEPILNSSSPLKFGLGWGMKHNWLTYKGIIPFNTPCNTQTAYPYEYFSSLYEITGEQKYKTFLEKIAYHVYSDFEETIQGNMISCSYSTVDERKVVNANSYRMYMLIDFGVKFNNKEYLLKGQKTLNYVISMQSNDGFWPYSENERFIDHYHTCFILKNLLKVKKLLGNEFSKYNKFLELGIDFYLNNLFYENGLPKPFAKAPRLTLYKYDSYDFAESINLLSEIPGQNHKLKDIIKFVLNHFQTKNGWFKFRLYKSPLSRNIPYMRYANSALFCYLTKVLLYSKTNK